MESKAVALASEYMQHNDVSHDIAHVRRVIYNGKKIWRESSEDVRNKVDLDILVAICALHDCLDRKYLQISKLDELRSNLLLKIQEFLGFSLETARFILDTTDLISYSAEIRGGIAATSECPYLAISRDADRLDSIGAIGAARCFAYSAFKNRLLVTEDFKVENYLHQTMAEGRSLDLTKDESAVCHFYDKLIKIKDRMKTVVGRALAIQRHTFLLQFLENLQRECVQE